MSSVAIPASVTRTFAISAQAKINPIGSGHIHQTFLVDDGKKFVLQRININVFTKPDVIARNNRLAADYLALHHPQYLFLTALRDQQGNEMVYAEDGFPWRLYPYIDNTSTVDFVTSAAQAYEAASGFGLLIRNLSGIDCNQFEPALDRFHDLDWRYQQFETARKQASAETIQKAAREIEIATGFKYLVQEYNELIEGGSLKLRVTHNDTKINNILFNKTSGEVVCVIDLDTLMPGYFIYDLGDLVRTCVSPVSEEEADITRITFRKEIYEALQEGYLSRMKDSLTPEEQAAMPFAGKMMTYIMALRFLADFLRGNTYYTIHYSEQNLVRARNQFALLELLCGHT